MNALEIRREIEKATRELAEMIGRRERPERLYEKRGEISGLYEKLEEAAYPGQKDRPAGHKMERR